MALSSYDAARRDRRNNQQQGLVLIGYLIEMGYRVGVSGESLVITSPDGLQVQTSLQLCNEVLGFRDEAVVTKSAAA
ncbi:MAG: hypothetical protein NVS9B15_22210 [Acidobacteriaceae bacterium]